MLKAFIFQDNLHLENITFNTYPGRSKHIALFLSGPFNNNVVKVQNVKFLGAFSPGIDLLFSTGEVSSCYFYENYKAINGFDDNSVTQIGIIRKNLFSFRSEGISCNYAKITGNSFINITNVAIYIGSLFGFYTEIQNNFIHSFTQWDPAITDIPDLVTNNIITNFRRGISTPPGAKVVNNVIMNSSEYAIYVDQPLDTAIINYNAFYNNREISNNTALYDPDTTTYYTADPMFENPDSNNYLLQMFSPLIDAGDPNILDVDGSRSDVGLYGGPYGQSYQYKDLPPKKPKVISATKLKNKVNFLWRGGTEADFNSFSLYRDRDPQFIPDDNNKIFTGIDTLFTDSLTDPTGSYSYKLTAKDNQGNVSKLDSVTVVLTGISAEEESPTPERIYLYQNYPNPFNPSTKIKFSLQKNQK
ncbi:MAG: hypothetical protein IPG53_15745 [Ignavibacteriales bacterium]|nr:hypothetical protein [Ignavibacteriales bacterium]